jgi:hypothetical protein
MGRLKVRERKGGMWGGKVEIIAVAEIYEVAKFYFKF